MQITKILEYEILDPKIATYDYACGLLAQRVDPSSSKPAQLNCFNKAVYTSPLARATSCIDRATASSIRIMDELCEIPFDLRKYCSKKEYETLSATAVRSAFMTAFINDDLDISHKRLHEEMESILSLAKTEPECICVSHTFRMKCVDMYLKNKDIFKQPESIREQLDTREHIFEFGAVLLV